MDELKLSLSTRLMRGIVAKLLSKEILKKCGCKIDIQLNEIYATIVDGEVCFRIDVGGKIEKDEFAKLIKRIGLE